MYVESIKEPDDSEIQIEHNRNNLFVPEIKGGKNKMKGCDLMSLLQKNQCRIIIIVSPEKVFCTAKLQLNH